MGNVALTTLPFTLAANTLWARPSLISRAISKAVLPCAICFTEPSGNVIFIILLNPFQKIGCKDKNFILTLKLIVV